MSAQDQFGISVTIYLVSRLMAFSFSLLSSFRIPARRLVLVLLYLETGLAVSDRVWMEYMSPYHADHPISRSPGPLLEVHEPICQLVLDFHDFQEHLNVNLCR